MTAPGKRLHEVYRDRIRLVLTLLGVVVVLGWVLRPVLYGLFHGGDFRALALFRWKLLAHGWLRGALDFPPSAPPDGSGQVARPSRCCALLGLVHRSLIGPCARPGTARATPRICELEQDTLAVFQTAYEFCENRNYRLPANPAR